MTYYNEIVDDNSYTHTASFADMQGVLVVLFFN